MRKKIEFICDFTNNKPTFINGSIRKIDKTIESIQDDYIWNKENDKDKDKGKDDYEIGM